MSHCLFDVFLAGLLNLRQLVQGLQCTLNSFYNEKKYAEILLRYRWVFIKDDVLIGDWGIFGAEVFLHYS